MPKQTSMDTQRLCARADTNASKSLLVCSSILSPRPSDPTDPYLPFLLSTQWVLSLLTGSGQRTTEISWSHSYPDEAKGMGRSKNHLFGSGPSIKGQDHILGFVGLVVCLACTIHKWKQWVHFNKTLFMKMDGVTLCPVLFLLHS